MPTDPAPMTSTADIAALIALMRGRVGSEFEDEAHFGGDEVEQIASALAAQQAEIERLRAEVAAWEQDGGFASRVNEIAEDVIGAVNAGLEIDRSPNPWWRNPTDEDSRAAIEQSKEGGA